MIDEKLITNLALEFAANYNLMDVADRKIIASALDRAMAPLVVAEPCHIYKGESRVAKVIQVGATREKQLEIIDVVTTPHGIQVKVL